MYISPVSFKSEIIYLKDHFRKSQPPKAQKSDVFIKSEEQKCSLEDCNTYLKGILKDLRSKKSTPESVADKFIALLKDKTTMEAFQKEISLLDTTPAEEIDTKKVEDFYQLTYKLENKLDETLKDRNKNPLIFMFLEPFDDAYLEYEERCGEIFGDEEEDDEDDQRLVLDLNSLVKIDDEQTDEEETKQVLTHVTEALKNAFEENPEPSFDLDITIDDEYSEEKYLNACKNLFKLVTMTRENAKQKEK